MTLPPATEFAIDADVASYAVSALPLNAPLNDPLNDPVAVVSPVVVSKLSPFMTLLSKILYSSVKVVSPVLAQPLVAIAVVEAFPAPVKPYLGVIKLPCAVHATPSYSSVLVGGEAT